MGYYIEVPENQKKATQIMAIHGAEKIAAIPQRFSEIPEGKALVAVIENGAFDAAMFIHDELELDRIGSEWAIREMVADWLGGRPVTYLLMDRALAEKLTGWEPREE